MVFENINMDQVWQWVKLLLFTVGSGVIFFVFIKYNEVKNSVGWSFIKSIASVKKRKYDLALRIKSPAGKESYQFVKQSPIISYEYFEKGREVKKSVIYDERAVDFLNGCPILNVSPLDIRPIDRDTGLLVNIPSEIIEKLAVDSSRTAEETEKKDKLIKNLVYGLIGMGILFIVALSYINQTNSELQVQLAKCALDLGKSVTVVAG